MRLWRYEAARLYLLLVKIKKIRTHKHIKHGWTKGETSVYCESPSVVWAFGILLTKQLAASRSFLHSELSELLHQQNITAAFQTEMVEADQLMLTWWQQYETWDAPSADSSLLRHPEHFQSRQFMFSLSGWVLSLSKSLFRDAQRKLAQTVSAVSLRSIMVH